MTRGRPSPYGLALLLAFSSALSLAWAQGPLLLKEVASREFSIHVGGLQDGADVREVASREFSIRVENGREGFPELASREFGIVVTDAAPPPVVTELVTSLSPTGDRAILDWSGYNQWQVGDIARFDIYFTDVGGFTDVTGMTPYLSLPSETTTVTLEGLAEFTDHFFAVVAVDALGNFDTAVDYSAAYILSPQVVSREFSLFIGGEPDPPRREVASREFGVVVVDADPPPALTNVAMTVAPNGEWVELDWSSYNQWEVGDIVRFDIYLSDDAPFGDVSGMTPVTRVSAGETSTRIEGLTPNTDHYLAVVPVDALGNADPLVNYSAAYVLFPELASREFSLFVGDEPPSPRREVASREYSLIVPDPAVPAPVTGLGSGFFVETSTTEFGAVELDWTSYNELEQVDVVSYRIYVAGSFFDDVTGLTPFATVQSGQQRHTLAGLGGLEIHHFAVVAEDALGQFDPVVRSFSAQASVSGVGEVQNLAAASAATSITFSWDPPPETEAFLTAYRIYFGGATEPVELPPGTTTWEAADLDPATGYPFLITTVDLFNEESAGSSLLGATLLPNPSDVFLTLSGGDVVMRWTGVEPGALVDYYEVYRSSSSFTDIAAATLEAAGPATQVNLGALAAVQGGHFAVVTVNAIGGRDPAVTSIEANKQSQTISFPELVVAGGGPVSLVANASSGLPVRFESDPETVGIVDDSGSPVLLVPQMGGLVTVTAHQDGDPDYWPAEPVGHLLRLPPVINSFTANGVGIENGVVLGDIDNVLRVTALDADGIAQAEFLVRPDGGSYTSLGVDPVPGDGLSALLSLDAFADGPHDLRVVVQTPGGIPAETTRSVTFTLAPPPPPQLTAPIDGTRVDVPLVTVTGTTARDTLVSIWRGGVEVAGPLDPDAAGNFTADIPLLPGDNLLTARATNRAGTSPASAARTVTLRSLLTLTATPAGIAEGGTTTLEVTRNHAIGGITVAFSDNRPGQINLPAPLAIADGSTTGFATATAVDDAVAELDQGVVVTATAGSYQSDATTLTVLDDDRPTLTVTLNRTTLSEGAAPGELLATFTRDPVTATPFVVEVGTDDPASLQPPAAASFAAHVGEITVPVDTIDNVDIDGDRAVTVFGRIADVTTGETLAQSNAAAVTVTDDDGPALTLRLARAAVSEGAGVTAVVGRNSGVGSPLTVSLSVDDATEAALPDEVTFLATQEEVAFTIDGLEDGAPDGNQPVLVEAQASGFSPAQAALVVTDLELPDIAVARLTVPETALTDDLLSYSYRIENQGPADTVKPVAIRVVLSDDPLPGDDTVVEEYVFRSPLPSELYFERAGSFFTPREAGTYHLLLLADYGDAITEILETNNLGVAGPIEIGAAYEATVETAVTVAPGGTPVLMQGTATNVADGTPAAFALVNVHVMVRDTERILAAMTNSLGEFAVTFNPLPGEGGGYTIGATHPGISVAEAQDAFTLLGFAAQPDEVEATITRNGPAFTGSFVVKNLADVPMTGLQVSSVGLPAGYAATASIEGGATAVPGLGEIIVDYELTADASAPANGTGALRVASAEGAQLDVPLDLAARDLESRLTWAGGRLEAGMIPGRRSFVELEVGNAGSVPTGPMHLVLPVADWLSGASASPLPGIAPAETASITLQLDPPADMPLTAYSGVLVLQGDHNTLSIPFTFRALSTATTTVTVICEDEYTYFADGKPPLQGATVTLHDAIDGSPVATGVTGPDGRVSFADVPEGYYQLKATADQHATHQEMVFVEAGDEVVFTTFLSRQTVEYVWTVVPTQIEDRYRIVVESVFETNVPAPVVTVEPSYVDLDALTEEVTQIDFTLTNHGLIAAESPRLEFTSTADWQVTPLAEDLGILPAKSSITVPVTIRDLAGGARAGSLLPGGQALWEYICGDHEISGRAPIRFGARGAICCGGGGGGGGGGGSGSISSASFSSSGGISCDPCILGALTDCLIGFAAPPLIGCAYSAATTDYDNNIDTAQTVLGCAGALGAAPNCIIDILQCIYGGSGSGGGRSGLVYSEVLTRFERHGRGVLAMDDFQVAVFGDEAWRAILADGGDDLDAYLTLQRQAITGSTRAQKEITASERAALVATAIGATHPQLVEEYCDRLNRTIDYNARGIFEAAQVPGGESTDFLTTSSLQNAMTAVEAAFDTARAEGYDDPLSATIDARDDLFTVVTQGDGVCAKVKLQITQDAVMTRDAFEASLALNNNATHAIEGIEVELRVLDTSGADATSLFGVTGPVLAGVTDGAVAPESSGSWNWTLIPTQDAAPGTETIYQVEGALRYTANGETLTVPLLPRAITVHPNPDLVVKYFHQRDVFSDDPRTDVIEPAIPFTLGVMIENQGAGTARNLRITSGQPEIVDNEKGLLIDFDIIATEVAGQSLSPGLTADFGDLAPDEIKVGRWLMTASVQGLFTDYSAAFEHVDGLGDERLSLIQSVEIHEMIHQIRALGARDDGLPDFLVNDIPDALDHPDAVHLSDGTMEPVSVVTNALVSTPTAGMLSVDLVAPGMGAGWTCLRIPDPGSGAYRLVGVTRSDALVIPMDVNVWTTDRTFIGLGLEPVREDILHLIDYDSTGVYTLTYEVLPVPDTTAPSSSVTALPADSGEFIELAWTGTDDTGVTGFDIYVATNGEAFVRWIENSPDTAAIFEGALGSSYAFYSIARDAAGNEEGAKSVGEATTSVTLVNQPPVLDAIPNLAVNEGHALAYQVVATDPDAPDSLLRYEVEALDPGITINPVTGVLGWITGESDGGSVVGVTVTVVDGAATPGTVSQAFNIEVIETNTPPQLADPGSHVIEAGETLSVPLAGSDADLPEQVLGYRFGSSPPTGMTLGSVSGLIEWTPGDEQGGQTFEVVVEAFDDQSPAGVAARTLRVEVLTRPGLPPEIEDSPILVWAEGGSMVRTFHASDPEGEPVTLSGGIAGLPGWVGFRSSPGGAGTLSWNTSGVAPGVYELILTASTDRQETVLSQPIEIVPRAAFGDYAGWTAAFGLNGGDAEPAAAPNPQATANLISYALGLDPRGGILYPQPEPRPHMTTLPGGMPALRLQMPAGGRPDLRYRIEHSTLLAPATWTVIATREGSSDWTGSGSVTTEASRGDLVWARVAPGGYSPFGFFRLQVEMVTPVTGGFDAWPGTTGATREERALGDANHDGFSNLVAYALGASSAGASLDVEAIVPPGASLTPGGEIVLSMHLAGDPRSDVIYYLDTSTDLRNWSTRAWWTVDDSDPSQATISVVASPGGGTDMSFSWPRGGAAQTFARLRVGFR